MKKDICLATSNPGKVAEYEEILGPFGYKIHTPKELGIVSDPDENGTTYAENAAIKALDIAGKIDMPVIADDSGLEIRAMGNKPGIHTARFAKDNGGYPGVFSVVYQALEGKEDRYAEFHCAICLVMKEGEKPLIFEGVCPGYITDEPKGTNGFGYDPIFHSTEANADFGTASEEIKNRFSHRGKASERLKRYLASLA